MSSGKH